MLYSSLLSISSPRLKYRHSTSPESPTIVHIGVRHRWKIVSPDGCIDAVSIEMYRLTNTPALVTDAEIKSNEFDTISGWKRCWHAWAKPTPSSRFSHARQRFYRTIALLALHIPQTEKAVLRSRFVGRSGAPSEETREKIIIFSLLNPLIRWLSADVIFWKPNKNGKAEKIADFCSVRMPMYTGFTPLFWRIFKLYHSVCSTIMPHHQSTLWLKTPHIFVIFSLELKHHPENRCHQITNPV